jgi:Zn-finger nucleic acid-binding protein
MSETVVCLACGGLVDPPADADPALDRCHCAPSSEAATVVCSECGGPLRVGARSCPHCGSTVATCRCPNCLAWNLAGAEHCQACGKSLQAHDDQSTISQGLHCPRCARGLATRSYADLEVEECDDCGGLFLTPAMLDRVVESRDRPAGLRLALPQTKPFVEHEVRYLHCPVCQKLMNRQAFARISGVVVDVCRSHGVWFDPGELTQVVQFVESGGLARVREREREEQREQARALRVAGVEAAASAQWNVDAEPRSVDFGSYAELGRKFMDALSELWRK